MMTNQYRTHRCRPLRCWAIIGALCIGIVYAGCADTDSAGTTTVELTKLAIDNLRVDSIASGVITVAFTINEPATIFWTLYAYDAPPPEDIDTVISNARASSSDPMIVQSGVQEEDKSDAGRQTITLANLPSARSYNLYVAAVGADGKKDLADAVPITTVRNISDVEIRRMHSGAIRINWTNPSAHTSRVLENIVIQWKATNNHVDDVSGANGSYSVTDILAANAKAHAILPIPSTQFFDYELSLTALYRDGSRLPPVTANYRYIIDDNGDGLIDIYTLEDLNNIRCNPEGTAYQAVGSDGTCSEFGIRCGIDGDTDCAGYELRGDLNFSKDSSYATGIVKPNWQANTASNSSGRITTANRGKNRGWIPIENIATTFEGNDHTIENLYVRDTTASENMRSGLFAKITTESAHIKNLTLKSATIYGGDGDRGHVGALAGELSGGTIENVAVIGGRIDGGDGNADYVGGIVGQNTNRGSIRDSRATGNIDGGNGNVDLVGGLVGRNNTYSVITDSRATGTVGGGGGHADQVGDLVGVHIDEDDDGLIDIYTLEDLNNIRCNQSGAAYQAVGPDGTCFEFGVRCGVDGTTDCSGYELRADLDFSESASYATGAVNSNWRANATSSNRGWIPIGSITTIFEGNGHTIENLYVRNTTTQNYQLSGLFARISGNGARIRNVTLKSAFVYGGSGIGSHVGALAGELSGGTIEKVAVIGGRVDGENGAQDRVGGLIGQNANNGTVRNSYATATVYGGEGKEDEVGGLVGRSNASTIIASYANATVYGGEGTKDEVGGLVGYSNDSTITASYATGDADGGGGLFDRVGGFVGEMDDSAIIASYATGDADGGNTDINYVGGLFGYSDDSTITASYAVGNAENGAGNTTDTLGHVSESSYSGYVAGSYIKNSYGFGTARNSFGGAGDNSSSPLPPGASRASHLTAPVATNPPNTAVPQTWDSAAERSKGAWDFGTSSQRPALRYADYDGDGSKYSCDQFPAPCGTLIPGQR